MTIAFGAATTAFTAATIAVPAHSDGDLLLLFVCRSYAATGDLGESFLQASGWNYIAPQGTISSDRSGLFWKIANSEPASYNDPVADAGSGGNRVLIMHSYSGVDPLDPINAVKVRDGASASSIPIGFLAVRPAHTGMAVSCCSLARGTGTLSAPGGWTQAGTNGNGSTGTSNLRATAAYRSVTAGDYPSANYTSGNSAANYEWYVCLKAADQPLATAIRDFSYGNTNQPTIPWATRDGDLLILFAASRASGTISIDGSWNVVENVSQAGYSENVFWRIADTSVDVPGTTPYTITYPSGQAMQLLVIPAAAFGTGDGIADTTSNSTIDLAALTFAAQVPDALMLAAGSTRGDVAPTAGGTGYTGWLRASNGGASGHIGMNTFFGWSAGPDAAANTLGSGGTTVGNSHHIMLGHFLPGGERTQVVWIN